MKKISTPLFFCILFSCTGINVTPGNFSIDDKIPSDKSLLVVYRTNSSFGAGAIYDLKIDDKSFGVLTVGQYKKIIIDPGTHRFKAFREIEVVLDYDLKPGMIYFLEESHAFGNQNARPKLIFVPIEDALLKLSKCYDVNNPDKLVQSHQIEKAKEALEKMTPEQKQFATQVLAQFTSETTYEDISKIFGPPLRGTPTNPQWQVFSLNDRLEADFINGKLYQLCYRQMFPFFEWKMIRKNGELKPVIQ